MGGGGHKPSVHCMHLPPVPHKPTPLPVLPGPNWRLLPACPVTMGQLWSWQTATFSDTQWDANTPSPARSEPLLPSCLPMGPLS